MLRTLSITAAAVCSVLPVSAQAVYHGAETTGATLGASFLHQTGESVNVISADFVGTVAPRLDLAASYASIRPSFGGADGWTASAVGTFYPLAGPQAWIGLSAGLSRVDAGFAEGTAMVAGASVAGRIEAGPLVAVPQLSLATLGELDGRVEGGVSVGIALGVTVPADPASLVLEPSVIFTSNERFADDEGFDPGVVTVGGTVRLLWTRGG